MNGYGSGSIKIMTDPGGSETYRIHNTGKNRNAFAHFFFLLSDPGKVPLLYGSKSGY
jgi:hypothetical protein